MKISNIIIAVLFFVFGAVQLNDPDPWIWVAIYWYSAAMAGMAAMRKFNHAALLLGIVVCLLGIGVLFPDFINWIKMGLPNIAESMKAEKDYIEFVREFFGLIICLLGLLFVFYQSRKK